MLASCNIYTKNHKIAHILHSTQPSQHINIPTLLHFPTNPIPEKNFDAYINQREFSHTFIPLSEQSPSINIEDLPNRIYSPEYEHALIKNAQFVHAELTTRFAHNLHTLEHLPYGLGETDNIKLVRYWYDLCLETLTAHPPPRTRAEDESFTTTILPQIINRLRQIVPVVTQSLVLTKATVPADCPFISNALNDLYASRLTIRLLATQHMSLHNNKPGFCGQIHLDIDPITPMRIALDEASNLCEKSYGVTPDVNILHYIHPPNNDHTATTPHHTPPTPIYDPAQMKNKTYKDLAMYNPTKLEAFTKDELLNTLQKLSRSKTYAEYCSEPDRIKYIASNIQHIAFEMIKNAMVTTSERFVEEKEEYSAHQQGKPINISKMPKVNDVNIFINQSAGHYNVVFEDFGSGIPEAKRSKLLDNFAGCREDEKAQKMLLRFDVKSTYEHVLKQQNKSLQSDGSGADEEATQQEEPQPPKKTHHVIPEWLTKPQDMLVLSSPNPSSMVNIGNDLYNNMGDGGIFHVAPDMQFLGSGFMKLALMKGFGSGVVISKLMAEVNGGEMAIESSQTTPRTGHTKAHYNIKLGGDAVELHHGYVNCINSSSTPPPAITPKLWCHS